MADGPYIDLWNDIVNNVCVLGLNNPGRFQLSSTKVYQGSQITFRWYPVKPTGSLNAPFFTKVPVSGITLDMAIGERSGAEAIKARQNSWTPDTEAGYLEATLNLNTTELNAVITGDSLSTYLEIAMTYAGSTRPVYQEQITITSVVIGPTGAASLPTAADQFLTREQCLAMFVQFINNPPGATIELLSPNGSVSRVLGANNDGSAMDETTQ